MKSELVAFREDGDRFAVSDGGEILVYRTSDQAPLWRADCSQPILGIGSTTSGLVVVDAAGMIAEWDWETGGRLSQFQATEGLSGNSAAEGCAVSSAGVVALVTASTFCLVARQTIQSISSLSGITAVAWTSNGSRLACGTADGTVAVYDVHQAGSIRGHGPRKRAQIGHSVRQIVWNSRGSGSWFVTAGTSAWTLSSNGNRLELLTSDMPFEADFLACSREGSLLVAARCGSTEERAIAILLNLVSGEPAGNVEYPARTIEGVAFGRAPWMAIALDGGDANLLDLVAGSVYRTDPHAGRPLNRWTLRAPIDSQNLPVAYVKSLRQSGPDKSVVSTHNYPGWMAPIVGALIGLGLGAKVARNAGNGPQPMVILGAAVIGFTAGLGIWLWERFSSRH